MAARNAGLHHHLIAGLCPGDQFAGIAHHARDIVAQNVRQRDLDSRQTTAHPHVEVVERARAHFDQNFVGFDFRVGDFGVLQHLRATVLREDDGFHRK